MSDGPDKWNDEPSRWRAEAARCREMAGKMSDPTQRIELLGIAARYDRMADLFARKMAEGKERAQDSKGPL